MVKTPLVGGINVAQFGGFQLQILDEALLGGPHLTIVPGREGTASLPPREWHLVTVVCRKSNYELWPDGILELDGKRTPSNDNKQQPKLK